MLCEQFRNRFIRHFYFLKYIRIRYWDKHFIVPIRIRCALSKTIILYVAAAISQHDMVCDSSGRPKIAFLLQPFEVEIGVLQELEPGKWSFADGARQDEF